MTQGVEVPIISPLVQTIREDVEPNGEGDQPATREQEPFEQLVGDERFIFGSTSNSTSSGENQEAPTGVSSDNLFSIGVEQERTPHLSPRPLENI